MKKILVLNFVVICSVLIFSCNNKVGSVSENNAVEAGINLPAISDGVVIPTFNGKVEIKVVFSDDPSFAETSFPKLKYNKNKAILMEFDDAALTVVTAYEKLSNAFYTDGCGKKKNYSLGLAVNGRNLYNNKEIGLYDDFATTYAQRLPLIQKGMDIMNHSYYHDEVGNFNYGKDRLKNVKDLDAMILLNQRYKMNALVVPSNYEGFHTAAASCGYLGGHQRERLIVLYRLENSILKIS